MAQEAHETWSLDAFEAQMRKDLARWGGRQGIEEVLGLGGEVGNYKRWNIYTDTNRYAISARGVTRLQQGGFDCGYLGCIATCRKPRAGEDWHRGSDLADGPLTMETWHRILADIVSYEMVKVHDPKKALADASIVPTPATAKDYIAAAQTALQEPLYPEAAQQGLPQPPPLASQGPVRE